MNESNVTAYGNGDSSISPYSGGSSNLSPQYQTGVFLSHQTRGSSSSQQLSTSTSSERPRVHIERLPSSSSSGSTVSTNRHSCTEPNCNTSCKRAHDLQRHVRHRHGNCAAGPFWLCEICGYWEYDGRQDKMIQHCRDRPNTHTPTRGLYPYHQVQSVGEQNHVAKIPTSDKLVRRRKNKVT